jgi:hypothetical protein
MQPRSTTGMSRTGCPTAERLESRVLLSTAVSVQSSAPPRVESAYVAGSSWAQPFRNYLQEIGLGSAAYGRRVSFTNFGILPWINLDQVSIAFNSDMIVGLEDLRVRGVGESEYPVAALSYDFDPARNEGTATWTIGNGGLIRPDRLAFELDADPETGGVVQRTSRVPLDGDGNGVAGGDFRLELNIVPGSANLDSVVSHHDFNSVRASVYTTVTNPGIPPRYYGHTNDLDGSGRVDVMDLIHVRRRLYDRLPRPDPAVATAFAPAPAISTATGDLFGSQPILA